MKSAIGCCELPAPRLPPGRRHHGFAVNVSPVQLEMRDAGAADRERARGHRQFAAEPAEIEITEAVLIRDDDGACDPASAPRTRRAHCARRFRHRILSLSHLKRFPFDKIKIDRCFASDIELDGSSAIVQAVVNTAAARNTTSRRPKASKPSSNAKLRELGCTQMQGYLFSASKPGAEVRPLLGMSTAIEAAVA